MRATLEFAAGLLLSAVATFAESGPQPAVTLDLKAFGMAPDLLSQPREDRDQARGLLNVFWISPDQLVAAFSTSPRYTKPDHPQPLQVRLIVFDAAGKQQATKDWNFSAAGPGADATLDIEPGPGHTILAIHAPASDAPQLSEGNQLQVLSSDTKLLENFYLPSNSVLVPAMPPGYSLVLQKFLSGSHSVLRFFSGHPLQSRLEIQLPTVTETLAGPFEAARLVCSNPGTCPTVSVTRSNGTSWGYTESPHLTPHPRAFVSPDTLLVEVEVPDKANRLLLLHADGSRTDLPPMKGVDSVAGVAGVAADGSRLAIDTNGDSNLCGFLDFGCSRHARSQVVDVTGPNAGKVIFEKSLSPDGGKSSLSPDGKRLAILDRGKVLVFALP